MTESASSLALAGFLTLVFVGFTLLAIEPLIAFDAYFNLRPPPPSWVPVLHVLDRVGQRAICLPVLAVVTIACCRREESWRPAVLAASSVFALNLVVGLLKIGFGRAQPASADPSFFIGGMAYPSGHTANIVLVYGLAAYLLGRYFRLGRGALVALWTGVAGLSLLMVVVSVTLNWHWFADLIAGLLVGGIVLELAVAADAAMPRQAFDGGLRQGVRVVLAAVRRRRTGPPGHGDVA
ncbi:phosphatase PAP2 family protein [Nocardioides mesophilus]|uniref:Phosphatase PAP2 family protein n=1 Tax=Nocardioides mesophilus TaxID=433659 RepID=A0A7G9RAT1_9ACTN|nr:phosphatase PAP2 family protein [Nocardioides mesophilus]QNN52706.1 phosphatase PAP2 family protein [Nocardioides mesophilus]